MTAELDRLTSQGVIAALANYNRIYGTVENIPAVEVDVTGWFARHQVENPPESHKAILDAALHFNSFSRFLNIFNHVDEKLLTDIQGATAIVAHALVVKDPNQRFAGLVGAANDLADCKPWENRFIAEQARNFYTSLVQQLYIGIGQIDVHELPEDVKSRILRAITVPFCFDEAEETLAVLKDHSMLNDEERISFLEGLTKFLDLSPDSTTNHQALT